MKILAIDDERGALKVLTDAIQQAVLESETRGFLSAREALSSLKDTIYDVAFCDIQMPEISGIELAKALKKANPNINVVFVTGYSDYAVDAMNLRASGYVLKPVTSEDIQREIQNLRNPPETSSGKIYAQTFGNFELFVGGEIVCFKRAKSKEFLAYLIDRNGAAVTRKETAAILFEDGCYTRATQDYLTKIVAETVNTLRERGAEKLIVKKHNSYAVDTALFSATLTTT